jgi:hypothetical protein
LVGGGGEPRMYVGSTNTCSKLRKSRRIRENRKALSKMIVQTAMLASTNRAITAFTIGSA